MRYIIPAILIVVLVLCFDWFLQIRKSHKKSELESKKFNERVNYKP